MWYRLLLIPVRTKRDLKRKIQFHVNHVESRTRVCYADRGCFLLIVLFLCCLGVVCLFVRGVLLCEVSFFSCIVFEWLFVCLFGCWLVCLFVCLGVFCVCVAEGGGVPSARKKTYFQPLLHRTIYGKNIYQVPLA